MIKFEKKKITQIDIWGKNSIKKIKLQDPYYLKIIKYCCDAKPKEKTLAESTKLNIIVLDTLSRANLILFLGNQTNIFSYYFLI